MSKTLIHIIFPIFLFLPASGALSQILPEDRRVDWDQAGLADDFPSAENVLNILDYDGDKEGQTANDEALSKAINDLNGQYGVIHFPEGTYLFKETIQLQDSVVLRGEGADQTTLQFDLDGKGHLINVEGFTTGSYKLTEDAGFGANDIVVSSTEGLQADDFVRIYQDDNALIASEWAFRSTGQINQIAGLSNQGILTLSNPLRMDCKMELTPTIEKINPVKGVVISCLRIERNDATTSQTSNIHFRYAAGCQVQGIESNRCNFAHVTLSYSHGIKVSGSYFHHAFSYGGGGKAYGVVAQFSAGNCLVENNIFENLRHAMLLQAGANGNVFAYNYSTNPFWEETLSPADAAGDLVLHGNYPYANLFEGNIGQNLIIDNSHKINGPINTFFRNRVESYGFIMFTDPPSDRQNIVGNDIPNLESSRGFFITFGTDHLIHGNLHKDEIIPANTTTVADTSYYLKEKPDFLGNYPWPAIGLPHTPNLHSIPAKDRYLKGDLLTLCGSEKPVVTGFKEGGSVHLNHRVYPNPSLGVFTLDIGKKQILPVKVEITDALGRVVFEIRTRLRVNKINLDNQPQGLYFLKIYDNKHPVVTLKVMLY